MMDGATAVLLDQLTARGVQLVRFEESRNGYTVQLQDRGGSIGQGEDEEPFRAVLEAVKWLPHETRWWAGPLVLQAALARHRARRAGTLRAAE